jgi:hypothetical protein
LANGNALIARLFYGGVAEDVTFWKNSRAIKSIFDKGVWGIVIQCNEKEESIQARKGVVVASGGFGRSPEVKEYVGHD